VSIKKRDGVQVAEVAQALVKRSPSFVSRSQFGVCTALAP